MDKTKNNVIAFPEWDKTTTSKINNILEIVDEFLIGHDYGFERDVFKDEVFMEPIIIYKVPIFDIMRSRGDFEVIKKLSPLIAGISIAALLDGRVEIDIGIKT